MSGWQELYIEFLANPTDQRTVAQFCKEAGITHPALYAWRAKHYDFVYQEANKRREKFTSQLREKALKALASRLEKSDKAIELALTLTGDLDSKPEVTHYHMLNPDERAAKAKELFENFKVRYAAQKAAEKQGFPSLPGSVD